MTSGDPVILNLQYLVDTRQLTMAPKRKPMDKINRAEGQQNVTTLCEEIELLRYVDKK